MFSCVVFKLKLLNKKEYGKKVWSNEKKSLEQVACEHEPKVNYSHIPKYINNIITTYWKFFRKYFGKYEQVRCKKILAVKGKVNHIPHILVTHNNLQ